MLLHGADAPPLDSGSARFVASARQCQDLWHAGTVEVYVDGDLADRTAALLAPYSGPDAAGARGEPFWSQ